MIKIRSEKIKKIVNKILFYILLLVLWQLLYTINVDILEIWKPYNFPSPIEAGKSLYYLMAENTLATALAASLKRIIIGYGISLIIGILIGLIISYFTFAQENLNGLMLGIQTLPNICWLPFAILWFGINESSILFVIVISSVFSIAMAIEAGIKNIDPLYIKAGKNMGAKGIKLYYNIIIPAALPSIISGMKQGWSFSWRGLIAGEMLSASKGLGQVLMIGRELADINQVTAIMIIIIIIGLFMDKIIFGRIEKHIRMVWGLNSL